MMAVKQIVFALALNIFHSALHGREYKDWNAFSIDHKISLELSGNDSDIYQQAVTVDSNAEYSINPNFMLKADARLQYDGQQEQALRTTRQHLWLRQLYLESHWQGWDWQLGRQIHNWSQMDNLVSFEQISPRDYHEFILSDFAASGRGQWMISAKRHTDNGQFQWLWAPQAKAHRLPTAPDWYQFRAPRLRYGFPFVSNTRHTEQRYDVPDQGLFAARYEGFRQQWQWSLQMRFGLDFEPLARNQFDLQGQPGDITLFHKNRLSLGASASTSLGNNVLRAEMSFSPKRHFNSNNSGLLTTEKANQLSIALGIDAFGPFDTFINIQMLWDKVSQSAPFLVRPEEDLLWSATLRRSFANDTTTMELRWYGSHKQDGLWRLSLSYLVQDNWEIKAGTDSFYGEMQTYFGQYRDLDRLYIQSQWYF